ncbi:MAG: putative sugar O-methyltransferase [Candidatus Njordarchaeales archaeon]
MFERATIELYKKLREESEKNHGEWAHSPVEHWKVDFFEKNLNILNLKNFRRTPLSGGLINFPDRPSKSEEFLEQYWFNGIPFRQKLRGVLDMSLMLYRLRRQFKFSIKDILDNSVGNPCYYGLGKIKITDFSIRMCYYLKKIEKEFAQNKSVKCILEIGGGFGGLCLRIMQSKKITIEKFIFVDLPECIALAYYYLMNNKINVKALVTTEEELTTNKIDTQVLLLPPWLLPKLDIKIDLFINTMSFQHMTRENIEYYLSEINRLNTENLFLVNRDWIRDKTDVKISDYPIPSRYWLVKEESYPFSKQLIRIYKLNKEQVK